MDSLPLDISYKCNHVPCGLFCLASFTHLSNTCPLCSVCWSVPHSFSGLNNIQLHGETPGACSVASVMSNSLRPCGLQPARLLCPRDSPGKNTGLSCHALLQGIFLTQGSNSSLPASPALQEGFFTQWATWEAHGVTPIVFIYSSVNRYFGGVSTFGLLWKMMLWTSAYKFLCGHGVEWNCQVLTTPCVTFLFCFFSCVTFQGTARLFSTVAASLPFCTRIVISKLPVLGNTNLRSQNGTVGMEGLRQGSQNRRLCYMVVKGSGVWMPGSGFWVPCLLGVISAQRRSHLNSWICYLMWQKGLCRCD